MEKFQEYLRHACIHGYWASASGDLKQYVCRLDEVRLNEKRDDISSPPWQMLLHLVNHGTDRRSRVPQRLHEFGVKTFDQDVVFGLRRRA